VDADADEPSIEIVEWAKALIAAPLSDVAVADLMGLAQDRDAGRAQMAAWALGFGEIPAHLETRALEALMAMLGDTSRSGVIRGHAAEAIGERLQFSGPDDPGREAAELRFVQLLSDASPDVRFWSAFGLGKLRTRHAVPALRKLTNDDTAVVGWWTVGEESADAIDIIEGREPPERTMARKR
jgi:hypothetical protein